VTTLRRRLVAGAAVLACAAPFGVAQAAGTTDDGNNLAVATTETDGARAFDFEYSVEYQDGGVVDNRNVANAAARCTDCRAEAIAFQIVLVGGSPSQMAPFNQAVAINDQCTRCVVFAGAHQFVRTVSPGTHITRAGLTTLYDVRHDLAALENEDLDIVALKAAVDEQGDRVVQVLTDELVTKSGKHTTARARHDRHQDS
jgi:putative peptide zinc metalloprotease protein